MKWHFLVPVFLACVKNTKVSENLPWLFCLLIANVFGWLRRWIGLRVWGSQSIAIQLVYLISLIFNNSLWSDNYLSVTFWHFIIWYVTFSRLSSGLDAERLDRIYSRANSVFNFSLKSVELSRNFSFFVFGRNLSSLCITIQHQPRPNGSCLVQEWKQCLPSRHFPLAVDIQQGESLSQRGFVRMKRLELFLLPLHGMGWHGIVYLNN